MSAVLALNAEHLPDYEAKTKITIPPEAVERFRGERLKRTYDVRVRGGVAIIAMKGVILGDEMMAWWFDSPNAQLIALDLQTVLANPDVHSILLSIDSPGGEVGGIQDLAKHIRAASQHKPVVAHVSGMCCSGAYWLASAANSIFIEPTSIVGSIGVMQRYVMDAGEEVVLTSQNAPHKNATPDTDEGTQQIQTVLDDLEAVFIEDIAAYRGLSPSQVAQSFGQGGVFVGKKALHMVDGMATIEDVINQLQGSSMDFEQQLSQLTNATTALAETVGAIQANQQQMLETFNTRLEAMQTSLQASIEQTHAEHQAEREAEVQRKQDIKGLFALFTSPADARYAEHYQALQAELLGDESVDVATAQNRLIQLRGQFSAQGPEPTLPTHVQPTGNSDFWGLVEQHMQANNCTKGQAIKAVADKHPDIHKAWLQNQAA